MARNKHLPLIKKKAGMWVVEWPRYPFTASPWCIRKAEDWCMLKNIKEATFKFPHISPVWEIFHGT